MALTLNSSHPLFADIVALVCVDDDNTVKDLMGDTCTPHANVTLGTGTYGRHFRTLLNASNAEGIALTTGHLVKPISPAVGTTVVVINAGNSRTSRGAVTNGATTSACGPACFTGDVPAAHAGGSSNPATLGTTDIIGTGAHMFAVGWNASAAHFVYCDGNMEAAPATSLGNASNTFRASYIGGGPTGGFGGLAADYVWYVHFRKYLSEAELDDLYTSLGAANTFGLVISGPADEELPVLTGSITVSALTDTSFTISWPAGSDNVAVDGYEYRIDGGSWVDVGDVLTANITGRTTLTKDVIEVRAYDAFANYSTPPLSVTVYLKSAGVTGADLRSQTEEGVNGSGFPFNDWDSGDDAAVFQYHLTSEPADGTLTLYNNGSFIFADAPDGVYSFGYRLFVNDVDEGAATVTLTVGDVEPEPDPQGGGNSLIGITAAGALVCVMRLGGFKFAAITAAGALIPVVATSGSRCVGITAAGALIPILQVAGPD